MSARPKNSKIYFKVAVLVSKTPYFWTPENLELFRVCASFSRRKSLQIEELEKSNLELRQENQKLKQNFEKIPQLCDENGENLKNKIMRLEKENANLVEEEQKLVKEIKSYKHQKSFIGVSYGLHIIVNSGTFLCLVF